MSDSSTQPVRVRFGPSPTGFLHVGGARTALFNWLFARHHGGAFVLRIEDTDRERSDEASYEAILDGMRWLGLDWDEGPGVGGAHGPYKQSERRERYGAAVRKLLDEGKAYACTCTPDELAARRKDAEAEGGAFLYDRRCRHRLGSALPGGPHVIRLAVPDTTSHVAWKDGVRKKVSVSARELDDFVLVKSDGFPTYNFAAVVDDAAMEMTDILRGDDHISNTPKQILLYEALGEAPPGFAHIPMILGPDGSRLSKRHGATSVSAYRDEGILPDAMVNFLALLGWSLDGKTEFFTREELIEKFTLDRVTKSAAVFNREKLEWMNGQYFRKQPEDVRLAAALEELRRNGVETGARPEGFWRDLVAALGDRFSRPEDAWEGSRFLFTRDIEPDDDALSRLEKWPEAPSHLSALAERLEVLTELTTESAEGALRGLAGDLGVKAGPIIHPARIALTGRAQSFGIFDVMVLLGKEETVRRLRGLAKRNRGRAGEVPDK